LCCLTHEISSPVVGALLTRNQRWQWTSTMSKWTKHWYTLVIGKWKFVDVALSG
jgi:hypothetical protein